MGEQVVVSVDDLHRFPTEWLVGEVVSLNGARGKELLALQIVPVQV